VRRLIDRALWWIASRLDRVRVLTNTPSAEAQSWYEGLSHDGYTRDVLPIIHVPGRDADEIIRNLHREVERAA
jgi:hypothetical protein